MSITLHKGDCLVEMGKVAAGSVDLILCDLPYGTTQNKWDAVIPFPPLWVQYRRVLTPKGAVVLTAGQPFTSALVMSNPAEFKYEWVWKKTIVTGVLNAHHQPMRNHESVLVFCAGKAVYLPQGLVPYMRMTKQGGNSSNYGTRSGKAYFRQFTNYPRSVLEIPSEGNRVHPTQKPVALMEYMIRTYTMPGATVMDNCMGSGTTGVACVNTRRKFIGIEQNDEYFEVARRRIAEAQESLYRRSA